MLQTPRPWPGRAGEEPVRDAGCSEAGGIWGTLTHRRGGQDTQKDTAPQGTGKTDFGDTFLLSRQPLNPLCEPPSRHRPVTRRGRLSAGGPLPGSGVRKGGCSPPPSPAAAAHPRTSHAPG